MNFFKLYKPKTYNYRYIYYDPKKEAQKEREEKYASRTVTRNTNPPSSGVRSVRSWTGATRPTATMPAKPTSA